jgi:hypothetical protein
MPVLRPQPGDQRKDFGKHLPWHRDFGQLEGDVPAVANDLGADLDQLFARISDHGSAVFGIANVRMKLPRLWARTRSWRRTAFAAKLRHESRVHLCRALALPYPLLRRAALSYKKATTRSVGRARSR